MSTLPSKNIEAVAQSIQWFGQGCIKIQHSGQTIYIDPYLLKKEDTADLILITHSHFDHFSVDDLKKIITCETVIYCPADLVEKSKNLGAARVVGVSPGYESEYKGIGIQTVPMYNILKKDKHPMENKWVGYVLNLAGVRVYHAGDTERIPEMKNIKCDIVLLPLGQTYTMNSIKDAADSVLDVDASVAIPIHFGMYEGKAEDAHEFKRLLVGKVEVMILEKG